MSKCMKVPTQYKYIIILSYTWNKTIDFGNIRKSNILKPKKSYVNNVPLLPF
jgi:hypothetical protein